MNGLELKDILSQELKTRQAKNSRYSMRAMANQLNMKPGTLSKIMNGKVRPTPETMNKILSQLAIDETLKVQIIESSQEFLKNKKLQFQKGKTEFYKIPDDNSNTCFEKDLDISVFLCLDLPAVKEDLNQLSGLLKITPEQLSESILRLKATQLVEERDGKLFKLVPRVADAPVAKPQVSKQNLQKCFLEKAISAVENVDPQNRLNGTLTMTVDAALIPKIKLKVDTFLKEINGMVLAESKKVDSIYNLTLALYPMNEFQQEGLR